MLLKNTFFFFFNLENIAFVLPDLLLNPGWKEDEREGNDLVINKKRIPNYRNIAGRLPKGPPLKRIKLSNLKKSESEATGLNSFPRKYCRGLNNKKTYWKKDIATGRAIN